MSTTAIPRRCKEVAGWRHPAKGPTWCAGLAQCVLRRSIEKDQTLRTGNWEIWPLSAEQQHYAALDAYASLLAYEVSRKETLN